MFDTNILIYAFDPDYPHQRLVAGRLVEHSLKSGLIVPRQVLGEWLAVAHRKRRPPVAKARTVVGAIEDAMIVIDTDAVATLAASELAERHRLQYFDALICVLAKRSGASILFSEDMHDGLRLGTMTIVNPFAPSNAALLDEALG